MPDGSVPAVVASTETTGNQKAIAAPVASELHRVSLWRPHISRRDWLFAAVYAGLVLVLGVLAGFCWYLVTPLQSVTVSSDGTATMTNLAAVEIFSTDAVFVMIGLAVGIILGIFAWRWFKHAGWLVVLLAVAGAGLCALVATHFGALIGPSGFDRRLAAATAGETVVFDLALTTPTAWVVWPFAAVIPVLVYSALTRDADDRRTRERAEEQSSQDPHSPRWAEEGRTGSGHSLLRFLHGQHPAQPAGGDEKGRSPD
ncbi:Uncharacterised protein [Propionibacterium australiense]|uniref:DUF2567 domain-containing protein n=2 Tax=Propionibacterium australiense TaxID=119981 RepID=A0A383S2M6_9ACTN|nr:hypothetical protein D9T14_02455 [Propionibacterium australiense]RLP12768.1 hypothetical protein D7U36_01945 [Propionibacterium australiense]SYZ32197.1 Hypothetical protein PROPAUS_0072 [Propionibacterium australiense]VEH90701.1 Uncharacterised protein [Propionibacterium australiense]